MWQYAAAPGASAGEVVALPNPAAGSYRVEGYLNTLTTHQGVAEIDTTPR